MKIEVEIRDGAVATHVQVFNESHPEKLRRLILAWVYGLPVADTGLDSAVPKVDDMIWRRLTQVIEGDFVECAVFIPNGADVTFRRKQ